MVWPRPTVRLRLTLTYTSGDSNEQVVATITGLGDVSVTFE